MSVILDLYAVTGNPILHSKSPEIYNTLFKKHNISSSRYIQLASNSAYHAANAMRDLNIKGLNVTSPFKTEIIDNIDIIDDAALEIYAVNTVVNKDGELYGYNTDYLAVRDLIIKYFDKSKGNKILVLGVGGAASAAIYAARELGYEVTISNRTKAHAKLLRRRTGCDFLKWKKIEENLETFKLLINATPHDITNLDIPEDNTIINAVYNKEFSKTGTKIIDGIEWLKLQAYYAFELYSGIKAEITIDIDFTKNQKKNISLIGFTGSGKTKGGRDLAARLNMDFLDVDELIIKKTGKEIKQIFDEDGEDYFREIEMEIIESLKNIENTVISCGGGAAMEDENQRILSEISNVYWIYSSPEHCLNRSSWVKNSPLYDKDPTDEKEIEKVKEFFEMRKPFYAAIADAIFLNESDFEDYVELLYSEQKTLR